MNKKEKVITIIIGLIIWILWMYVMWDAIIKSVILYGE